MKKYCFLIFAFLLIPTITIAGVIIEDHWDTQDWASLEYPVGKVESVTCSSDPYCGSSPDGSKVLRFTFKAGLRSGQSPAKVWYGPVNATELWVNYWFKYSSNYQWESTQNKHFYLKNRVETGAPDLNNLIIFGIRGSRQRPSISIAGGGTSYYQNNTSIPELNIESGRWYKAKLYFHMNTAGTWLGGHNYTGSNGAFKVWIDDVLIMDYASGVPFRKSSAMGGTDVVEVFDIEPVYGGAFGPTVPADQYLYYDYMILSTTPIDSSNNNVPSKIPSSPEKLAIN